MEDGMGNNLPISGTAHVEFTNGKRSTSVCRLDELKQWSVKTQFYAWLGWWLLAISVALEILIDAFEYGEYRQKQKPHQFFPVDRQSRPLKNMFHANFVAIQQ
jgi:hypothetical protein